MKIQNIFLTAGIFLFIACSQSPQPEGNHNHAMGQHTSHKHDRETEAHRHESAAHNLALNSGQKWETDESTRAHAAELNEQIDAFSEKPAPEKEDFHLLAQTMQEELNQLIKDCRMKGPEHDALHLWLEPVLASVKKLSETDSEEAAGNVFTELSKNTGKFNQYFD